MANRLSGRHSFGKLCGFAGPAVFMLVVMSLYTMVDGIFVARLVGTDALSAVNIVFPFISAYWAFGIMLATGSAAIVVRQLGEGRVDAARSNFTFMLLVAAAAGVAIGWAGYAGLEPLLRFLGATPEIFGLCRGYAAPLMLFVPCAILQMMFQTYFIAAGRPGLGFAAVALGGLANVVLDYLFIAVLEGGVAGAAWATGIGCCIPALAGLVYFAARRPGGLYFVRPEYDGGTLLSSVVNGSSEMVSNVSAALVAYLFNLAMLRRAGVDGVAAITIVLYAEYLLNSIYFGFAVGVSPLFSYKFGKNDADKLKILFRNSLRFIALGTVVSLAATWLLTGSIIAWFAPVGGDVYTYAFQGMKLFSIGFAFIGFNVFLSALFTAFSNGKVSALLAFARFAFIAAGILVLPDWLGIAGIWLAVPLAEIVTLATGAVFVHRFRNVYHYA